MDQKSNQEKLTSPPKKPATCPAVPGLVGVDDKLQIFPSPHQLLGYYGNIMDH